jgi:hypothetical protein
MISAIWLMVMSLLQANSQAMLQTPSPHDLRREAALSGLPTTMAAMRMPLKNPAA